MSRVLRVLMTATSFPQGSNDWRGRFIFDMAENLAARDDLNFSLWAPPGQLPPRVVDATSARDQAALASLNLEGGIAHLLRKRRMRGAWRAAQALWGQHDAFRRVRPDVGHVNWMQNVLALGLARTPTLVTVLGMDFALLRSPSLRQLLRISMSRRPTILCPNADWMASSLEQWFGDQCIVQPIPFGVQPGWFEVERRPVVDPPRWLVVSRVTEAKLGSLLDWGARVFPRIGELHLVGPMQEDLALPSWIHHHGPMGPASLREDWFPKVAGLVTLSRHDEGRPQVLLEAMAAGVPVIASRLPAHLDLIEPGRTGFIVDSAEELEHAMTRLSDADFAAAFGARARAYIRERIGTWEDTAARYAEAYRAVAA